MPAVTTARLRSAALLFAASAALALPWACAPRPASGPQAAAARSRFFGSVDPPRGQIFRFNNGAEPERIDPGLLSGQPDGRIARALFEGLVTAHPRTLDPMPGQAERWELSADGRTYTFHLRRGLTWSDGTPLGARDFEWAWKRVLDPETGSRYAGLLYPIENGQAFNEGTVRSPDSVGVHAADDTTLVVRLAQPTAYFLHALTYYTYLPVPRHAIERHGDRWTRPENIVHNGPFRIREWRPRAWLEMEPNPRYWDREHVRLEQVVAYPIDDLTTSTNLYKAGVLDWQPSGYIPAPFLPFLDGYEDFVTGPQHAVYFYSANITRPPLDNVWVRRALATAIDRTTLADKVLKGTRPAWGNFVPTGYAGYPPPPGQRYDPQYARDCLARAGYPGGKGFPPVEILFNTSEDHRRIAEAIQAMWHEALGISVGLSNQEWASYLEATTSLHYQIARRSWIGDYPDPTTFLDCFRGGDGNNRTGWSNAEYDRLLAGAAAETDVAARLALLSRAERILLEEAPVIPIYHYRVMELVKPYVRGLYPTVLDVHPLKEVWIDHDWQQSDPAASGGATAAR
jgi:ABC-type oligopeptide transport system substrate-binding subunit